jgi:nucleotide-binding universal stress UspA family protein
MVHRPNLLLAYDGSPTSKAAVRAAAELFPGASTRVVSVYEPPLSFEWALAASGGLDAATVQASVEELVEEARAQARQLAEEGAGLAREDGLDSSFEAAGARGAAWPTLLEQAEGHAADLMVCGTRGRGAFARAALGSTSSGLVHHADRPVLTVPDGAGALDGPVLVAFDGSESARTATATAGRLLPGRSAVVLYVWESPVRRSLSGRMLAPTRVDEVGATIGSLAKLLGESADVAAAEGAALARESGLVATGEALETSTGTWRAINAAAAARSASVIVAGSRGRGGAASALLGSVSSGLVHNAERPTLIVPSSEGA